MSKSTILKDITSECNTKIYLNNHVVFYKGVPLWATIYPNQPSEIPNLSIVLEKYEYEDEDDSIYDSEPSYTILGKTPVYQMDDVFDYSTYGDWTSEKDANEWLEHPVALY